MNKLKKYFPQHILLSLYNTLVLPYINYCNISWATTIDKVLYLCPWTGPETTNIDNIFKLQKRALRICAGSTRISHTKPLFYKFNVLNVFDLNKLQTDTFMYRFKNNSLPTHICSLFPKQPSEIHDYKTRFAKSNVSSEKYISSLQKKKKSIFYNGPKLWNSLDTSFKSLPHLRSFKYNLKKSLVSVYGR